MRYEVEDDEFYLTAENYVFYQNKIWFSELECNELYCYDVQSQIAGMVCKFYDEDEYRRRLFGDLIPVEEKLYLLPYSAEKMYEVDIVTGNVNGIEIDFHPKSKNPLYNEKAKFLSGHVYNDCIYLMPASYPAMIEYNRITGKISYYDEWIDEIKEINRKVFFRKTIIVKNKIYAPSCMENFVLEFDVETKQYCFYEVGDETCSYSSICKEGDWFWLSPRAEGPIVKWNIHTNQWKIYRSFPDCCTPCKFSYANILSFCGYIYCIPLCAEYIVRIGKTRDVLEAFLTDRIRSKGTETGIGIAACAGDNELYFFSYLTGEIIIMYSDGSCEYKELLMPEEQKQYHKIHTSYTYQVLIGKEEKEANVLLRETYVGALKDYCRYIFLKEGKQYVDKEPLIGKRIYEKLLLEDRD